MRPLRVPLYIFWACVFWQVAVAAHRLQSGLLQSALQPWQPPDPALSGRHLQQTVQPTLLPEAAQPATGTDVVSIISNATQYWPYLCVNSCAQARNQASAPCMVVLQVTVTVPMITRRRVADSP